MPSIRFRLDHPSLDGVADKARERYGADARVLSAEEVRTGGIGGFFARRYIDVVVEVPDGPSAPWTATRTARAGGGIQELLDAAEAAEADPVFRHPGIPPVSTESGAFIDVLDDLRRNAAPTIPVREADRARTRPVTLLRAPGDLAVIAGIGEDPLVVARDLASGGRLAEICTGGTLTLEGYQRVTDRRTAFAARARGVERGRPVIVAFTLQPGEATLAAAATTLLSIGAGQLWVAVDASRKADDTERWVKALTTAVPVQAMAVLRSAWTTTPASVNSLGLPQGWTDSVG